MIEDVNKINDTELIGSTNKNIFPIVGIGASAGGLAALEEFFSALPKAETPEMAFVVVQHLAPDHNSLLTELIGRHTNLQVLEVKNEMPVEKNKIYIIPPAYDMTIKNGILELNEPEHVPGSRSTIDNFLFSLAEDRQEQAFCVILSGNGSDGSKGAIEIKRRGGIVAIQSLETCEFDSMPRSTLETGFVDFQQTPKQIPDTLIKYTKQLVSIHKNTNQTFEKISSKALIELFEILKLKSGHNFKSYKPSTIRRRIERRMAIQQVDQIESYINIIRKDSKEVESLFYDLLIGVTSFFRDKESFQSLEKFVIPKLFEGKIPGETIRVWSTGCSTGEEAYSLAIIFQEFIEVNNLKINVQIFATDINNRAITTARTGLFSSNISEDISPERLQKYFTAESNGQYFRISKEIRNLLILSKHDIIKDPPFSKMDLICCRNLLIYLGNDLQAKIIPLLHYALKSDGYLFLGESESIGNFGSMFKSIDRNSKIFQSLKEDNNRNQIGLTEATALHSMSSINALQNVSKSASTYKLPLRELTENAILSLTTPAGALVNEFGDILYLIGHTGSYLELPSGESSVNNILVMIQEELRREMTDVLQKAVNSKKLVRSKSLKIKKNQHYIGIRLSILPLMKNEISLFAILIEESIITETLPPLNEISKNTAPESDCDQKDDIEALMQKLKIKEEALHLSNEELATSYEEIKSFKEEMQSVNEELQSTNEELETSKEELQSVNEELITSNSELQNKVVDLSRVNNDMNNLLNGTGIGTIFVDKKLQLLRFTPSAKDIINLIQSDIGRPLSHIASNMVHYPNFIIDIQTVLDTLETKVIKVQSITGKWYTLRIQPYKTIENVTQGAVVAFVDSEDFIYIKKKTSTKICGDTL